MPKTEAITIETSKQQKLAAKIDYAAGAERGWAIFAHCFTCSKDSLAAARVAQEMAMEGISTLRIDFTGLGQSEGDFGETSFTSNIEDVAAAAAWLGDNKKPPTLLVGHSLGGAAVLAGAAALPSIKGVATIGAPADPQHVKHLFEKNIDEIKEKGIAEVNIGGRPIRIGEKFVNDLMQQDAAAAIASIGVDLLVMHSPIDKIVGIENAAMIYRAAKHPKSYVSLDQADHLLTKRSDSHFAAKVISAWAVRCIGDAPEIKTAGGDDALVVQTSPDGLFAHDIRVGNHRMRADEPTSMPGGRDSGPAPYDFLKAGLGACTAITIRMVAERRKYNLESCRVIVTHRREGEGAEQRDVYLRELILEGDLAQDEREFLLGIANKCPVHKSLERGAEVETVLKD